MDTKNKNTILHPAQEDFRKFVYMVWKHLNLPDPTPMQYDIARYLATGPKRCVVEAFRGVGKSWLTSAFVVWTLWNNPQKKILVVSASAERANQFAIFVHQLINGMDILQHLKPGKDQRDSRLVFDVGPAQPDQSPSVKAAGITGQITGSRADIIIADDVETPQNSATQIQRDKISEAVKEFDAILKPLPTSRIIYLGTPQTEMSLYNRLPERGYGVRIWPAEYPRFEKIAGYKGTLAPTITKALEEDAGLQGKPTDIRFNDTELSERRVSYGPSGYALQFMLDTSLSDMDRYPLKLSDFIVQSLNPTMAHIKVAWSTAPELCINDLGAIGLTGDRWYLPMWHDPQMTEYTGCVMAIDPSGRGADETGYAIVKILAGNLFLVAAGGLLGGYSDETLTTLAKLAKQHQVKHVIIEANFGDGMYTQLITPKFTQVGYPVMVEEVKHNTQKEKRIIDTLEPILSSHRLIVDRKVIEQDLVRAESDIKYSLFYQLTRITRERGALIHDDRLDALAMAVAYWVEHMSRDNSKAAADIRSRAIDNELKKFVKGILGSSKDKSTWTSTNSASR